MPRLKKFTKLLLSSAALSTLIACGNDTEIPSVSVSSPYSCNNYNEVSAVGDEHTRKSMLRDIEEIFNSEYQGDSTIENFYRSYLFKKLSYGSLFIDAFKSECLKQPEIGVLEAGQLAINNVWKEIEGHPRHAMCWSINNGIVDASTLIAELDNQRTIPQANLDVNMRGVEGVLESPEFGQAFIEGKVTNYCNEKPNLRAWKALAESVKGEAKQIVKDRQAALDKEAEERAQKRQQEKMAENLKKYSGSVTGESKPRFATLEKQLELAEKGKDNYDKFLAGLKLSIQDVAAQLPEYKRKAIEPLDDELAYAVAGFMIDGCMTCEGGYLGNLKHFPKVKEAQSDVISGIQKILDGYTEAVAACVAGQKCEAEIQKKAAGMALSNAKTCDAYRENGIESTNKKCFEVAQQFYDHWYSILARNTKG